MIKSLAKASKLTDKPVDSITMVGGNEKISWKQTAEALIIRKPANMPSWQVIGFRIEFKK